MARRGWIGPVLGGLLLALVLLRAVLVSLQPLQPAAADPASQLVAAPQERLELALQGRLLVDPRPSGDGSRCTALLQLPVGRSELQFSPCPAPPLQQGWVAAGGGPAAPAAAGAPSAAGRAR
jgi:competence protein ComEC